MTYWTWHGSDLATSRRRVCLWAGSGGAGQRFIGLVLGSVNLANASMLYLVAVMATAVAYGRGPAIFASITAFLVFDWFFVEPHYQFTVSDPDEWVSLLLFLA